MKAQILLPILVLVFVLLFYYFIYRIVKMITSNLHIQVFKKSNNIKSHCIDCTKIEKNIKQKDSK